jgi:hypothetical protein
MEIAQKGQKSWLEIRDIINIDPLPTSEFLTAEELVSGGSDLPDIIAIIKKYQNDRSKYHFCRDFIYELTKWSEFINLAIAYNRLTPEQEQEAFHNFAEYYSVLICDQEEFLQTNEFKPKLTHLKMIFTSHN